MSAVRFIRNFLILVLASGSLPLLLSMHSVPQNTPVTIAHDFPKAINTSEEKTVSLTLNKGSITGPARLKIETRNAGMEMMSVDLAGGEFVHTGDEHSIAWTEIPASSEVKCTFRLKAHRFFTGSYIIKISFSYLENGNPTDKTLDQFSISIAGTALAKNNSNTNINNNNTTTNTTTNNNTTNNTTVLSTNTNMVDTSGRSKPFVDPITKKVGTPIQEASAIMGLFFRVQVAASHFRVSQEYFTARYKFDEPLYIDEVDGWIKYTVGDFKDPAEAFAKRKTLLSYPFKGPFVVAFNDGKRIPVYRAAQLAGIVK